MSNLAGYGRAKAKMPSKFKFLCVDMKNVMVSDRDFARAKRSVKYKPITSTVNRQHSVDSSPPSSPPSSPATSSASVMDLLDLDIDMNAFYAEIGLPSSPNNSDISAQESGKRKRDDDDDDDHQIEKRIKMRNEHVDTSSQPNRSGVAPVFNNVNRAISQPNIHYQEPLSENMKQTILELFGTVCPKDLQNMPDPVTMQDSLVKLPPDIVKEVFEKFVIFHAAMADKYFCAFAECFAAHKMRNQIKKMAKFCQSPFGRVQNLIFVVNALASTGMPYSIAALFALSQVSDRSLNAANVFYEIITDLRNDNLNLFKNQLRAIFVLKRHNFTAVSVDRFMRVCIQSQTEIMAPIQYICWQMVNEAVFDELDYGLAKEFPKYYWDQHSKRKIKASKQLKK